MLVYLLRLAAWRALVSTPKDGTKAGRGTTADSCHYNYRESGTKLKEVTLLRNDHIKTNYRLTHHHVQIDNTATPDQTAHCTANHVGERY